MRYALILMLTFVLLAGCQSIESTTPLEATLQPTLAVGPSEFIVIVTVYPVETMTPFTTISPEEIPSFEPTLNTILSQVKSDLSQKTGVGLEKINILEVDAVEWPDSSLGCGVPGTIYLPVITPGFRIVLEADGRTYTYHTNTSNQIVLCEGRGPLKIDPTP